MATNNRGGNRGGNRSRGQNNNAEGRNQYSGWTDTAKDRPFVTAAAAAAAVGAGVFLWSRRNQITEQLSNLNDQISDWREGLGSDSDFSADSSSSGQSFMASSGSNNRRGNRNRSQSEIAEEALTLKETGKATA